MSKQPDEWNEKLAAFAQNELNGERVSYKPAVSFQQYCESQGVSAEVLARLEHNALDSMCMSLFKPALRYTTSVSNKHSRLRKESDQLTQLRQGYNRAVSDGVIAKVAVKTPLDPNRGDDRAYVRLRLRRQKQREHVAYPMPELNAEGQFAFGF